MKFTRKPAKKTRNATAAQAVHAKNKPGTARGGFTLLELIVVIAIIGILSGLAYSSLIDLVFTNRAKESAQVMRAFAERSLAEAKRQNTIVVLSLGGGSMEATFGEGGDGGVLSQPLSDGFKKDESDSPPSGPNGVSPFDDEGVASQLSIGVSGITEEGSFVACGSRGFCAAVVKTKDKNSFTAHIRKGYDADWEAL